MSKNVGIYIHIPYCRSKCPYCDFFSMRGNSGEYQNYVSILKESILNWSHKIDKTVDTIYIGGGTPSVLSAEQIADIISAIKASYNCADNMEITMEANPKSALRFDFPVAVSAGLNRVSLGLQSSDENELRLLGRTHNNNDVISAIKMIKNSGINNISVDLMLGIPSQTIDSLKASIDFCLSLDVQHISSYILKIEENTVYDKKRHLFSFPDEDLTAELYLYTIDYLEQNGFNQYEISNFCIEGYESKHNIKYWNLEDYLGIGPAAHSFIDGQRFYYERSVESFRQDSIVYDGEGGSSAEYIMLKLRLTKGLNLNEYKEVFGSLPDKDFFDKLEKYSKLGYIQFEDDTVCLTKQGFLVSNSILSDLI